MKKHFFLFKLALVAALLFLPGPLSYAEEKPQASHFSLKALDGVEVSLDQFRGKFLLINFWATWCGPCKVEMPSLQALHDKFKSENFEILAISNDMFGEKVVRPYVEANKLSFTVLLDQNLSVSHKYGVVNLPTTFLIDPRGKIIGVLNGATNWSEPSTVTYLEDLLNKNTNSNL